MSRVAKSPIKLPAGVSVELTAGSVEVRGPGGVLRFSRSHLVEVVLEDGVLRFRPLGASKFAIALSGTTRAIVNNMVIGTTKGFEKKLVLFGTGYRVSLQGSALNLSLGYSHPVIYEIPQGIVAKVLTPTELIVSGIDKQLVGLTAANIRSFRSPDPYKGKGVRYADEVVVLKEVKKK
ncbi:MULTISPECIES: 50S ribosomal protein L6 [Candidatus Ichthyocystis]|uniref:Large ribosomal subunit protein uL6 n=1 Tax=Candidatus Ichthyocystis hellenicum TaxID=1561003 RepID=A0A0S4M0M0_9BURK|nr:MULTISPECIES: 50S ribosomal protein L6 [Ichthyocystis]CUT17365.1 50S ribosomal protein L6 [Candidatus Ichthyocystis hellenicum]